MHSSFARAAFSLSLLLSVAAVAQAQQAGVVKPDRSNKEFFSHGSQPILTLAQAETKKDEKPAAKTAAEPKKAAAASADEYREISDFFNVREANATVRKGEWEFEVEGGWFTHGNGEDDEFGLAQTLKYGITDKMFVELEVAEDTLGDGGESGAGEIYLTWFNQCLAENGGMPALAHYVTLRLPTGAGSEGVDASFHAVLTKTITDRIRGHLEGYVTTANGGPGDDDDRKHFLWGIGPGVDYKVSDATILTANYVNRASEADGGHNQNILEFGVAHEIAPKQHVKLATDIGLDGAAETPNLGAKFQWSIEW